MNYEATSTKTLLQHILHQHNRKGKGRGRGERNISGTQLTGKGILHICFEKSPTRSYLITLDRSIVKYDIHEILFMLNGKGSTAYLTKI